MEARHGGNQQRLHELIPRIYAELHRLTDNRLASEHTPNTTAAAHELWLRLDRVDKQDVRESAQFFSPRGRIMRHILVDHTHARAGVCLVSEEHSAQSVAVDETP